MQEAADTDRILVIKHGALGDLFQAFGVFATIRHHFPKAHIALLTRPAYQELMEISPWFDEILCDDRLSPFKPAHWQFYRQLYRNLRRFDIVFDFQNAGRTRFYFRCLRLLSARKHPVWSGHIRRADLFCSNPQFRMMHTLSRQESQLRAAGLTPLPRSRPDWLASYGPVLQNPYIILVPGAARHHPGKCWPAERFAALVPDLAEAGFDVVITGDKSQKPLAEIIKAQNSALRNQNSLIDLTGKTTLPELAGLVGRAHCVLGNDTGTLHIAAAMNRPCLTLFSHASDPRRTAPIALEAGRSHCLQVPDLARLPTSKVISCLKDWNMLDKPRPGA